MKIIISKKLEQTVNLLLVVFSTINRNLFSRCFLTLFVKDYIDQSKLYEIRCLWIKGKTPVEISLETGCDIYDVDDVCNKVISYRLNILIGNICDLINVPEDDDAKVNPYITLNILQNKIKYGVSSQTAISICEKMFNDRVIASKLSEILMSAVIDTDSILRTSKWFEDDIFELLNDYPTYFSERLNYLLR